MDNRQKKSDLHFRALFEGAPDAIVIADAASGAIIDVNPQAQRLFNLSREELIGKDITVFHPPERKADYIALFKICEIHARSGRIKPLEEEVVTGDGRIIPVELSGCLATLPDGRQIMYSVYRDITERKEAEEEAAEAAQMLRTVLDTIPVRVFWKDRESLYLGCNRPFATDAGFDSPDEITGRSDYEMGWKDQADLYTSDDRAVIGSGQPKLNYEEPQTTPDGSTIWLRTSKIPLRDLDDRVIGVLGAYEDITERKRAVNALRLNEARLEAVLKLTQMASAPVQELADFALEEAVNLTKSQYGYWALVNEDESVLNMYAWSKAAREDCAVPDKPLVYAVAETGLWGEAIRQRRPIITNDYSAHSRYKRGMPDGHVPIMRHMNVPVFEGDSIVAVAGVANKEEPYDESDVRQLTLLMAGMWRILMQRRSEDALRESERHKRVFYRETIRSVTDGRLEISEPDEVEAYTDCARSRFSVSDPSQACDVRKRVKQFLTESGMSDQDRDGFITAVGEAITNSLKHAGRGQICCGVENGRVWVSVSDQGPGIDALVLPRATLMKGFSTKPSLGLGYSIILEVSDRVMLSTGPQGTTIVMIKDLAAKPPAFSLDDIPDTWGSV